MADKTNMTDLLPVLERLCLEYRAMEFLLTHYHPDGSQWIRRLRDSQKVVESQVFPTFDALRGNLQSGEPDAVLLGRLITALNEVTLLNTR
jgi:hypothetical protein